MFVALRELRAARWRFALITSVVLLLALLVAGLSGLTGGLAHQNISAVTALGDGPFGLATTAQEAPDPDRSVLEPGQVEALSAGAPGATPVGIARVRFTDSAGQPTAVVVIGLDRQVGRIAPPEPGTVLLSPGASRALGDGTSFRSDTRTVQVSGGAEDLWYSHSPVVVTDLATWRELAPHGGAATLVAGAVEPSTGSAPAGGTSVVDADALLGAMPSYQAERGSLTLMTTMLMAIAALVAGAFFTVWGIQRRADVAVLKALGASTAVLVRDWLGQAVTVLVVGVATGVGLAAVGGVLIPETVPYVVTAGTTVVPALALVALGLLGAAASLRPVLTADPTTALGALR